MIGTTIEWYDFYLYGVASALIFGPQFFPSLSTTAGTLASFATFAAGFIARPVGAVVFGYFGDRVGRKSVLMWSLLLTGIGTVSIGLLPTFASIGVWAPVLLVALRLVQGIGVGGEWSGAVIMAGEHAPADRKGEYAGWPQLGSGLGLLLANGAFLGTQSLMSDSSFDSWGWRVPFLLSVVMIAVGVFIRLRLEESPEFAEAKAARRVADNPLATALFKHPKTIALAAGVFCFNNTAFFLVNTFGLSYLKNTVGVPSSVGLGAVLGGAVLLCFGTYYLSRLSDRIDARTIIVVTYAVWIPFAFILFGLLRTGSTVLIYAGIMTGMLMISFYGPLAGFLQKQFHTEVRYSGLGLAVQFGAILGGGAGPLIATQLNASVGVWGVSTYVAALAVIGIVCAFAIRPTREASDQAVAEHPARSC